MRHHQLYGDVSHRRPGWFILTKSADRASGAFFSIFGLLLYFYIIPNHIEPVDTGWVYPSTIPNAVAIILVLSGTAVFCKPTRHCARPASEVARAGLFLAVLCFGIWLISKVGFIWAAPGVAVGLMALMGERRGFWLLMGAGATPAVIWLLVDVLLDRSLP